MTPQEIRALNQSMKELVKLTCMCQEAAIRERQEWEDSLIQKIRRARFNKTDLTELHIKLDKILANR